MFNRSDHNFRATRTVIESQRESKRLDKRPKPLIAVLAVAVVGGLKARVEGGVRGPPDSRNRVLTTDSKEFSILYSLQEESYSMVSFNLGWFIQVDEASGWFSSGGSPRGKGFRLRCPNGVEGRSLRC